MNFNRLLAMLLIVSFFGGHIHSQVADYQEPDTKIFTLQMAIDYALHHSFNIKTLGLNLEDARQNLKSSRGRFKTNAQLNFLLPSLSEQLMQIESTEGLPIYWTRGSLRFTGMLDINQPLPTNGVFTLFGQLYQQDETAYDPLSEVDLKRREFYTSLGLRFTQPLFTINTLKLGYEEANLNYERASGMIRRIEMDVIYEVTWAFYNFYRATRELAIATENQRQQEDAFNLATKKYAAGLIPEVEALQTEVDLAQSRNRVFTANSALQRQADFFKQAIGIALSERVAAQTTVEYRPFAIDLAQAIASGLANRSELRERAIERRLREIDILQIDARSEFKAELSAYYDLSGISDTSLPPTTGTQTLFRSSWNDLKDRPKNRGIFFSVSMPLWDSGVNAAEVASARARLDEASLRLREEEKTVEREIRDVVARVREAQNRLEVLQKSENVAERSYEISMARFDNGDITTQELALDRERLTQARTAYLEAFIDYQVAIADLKRKTLYDFEKN